MNKMKKEYIFFAAVSIAAMLAIPALCAAPASPQKEMLGEGEAGIVHVEGDVKLVAPSGALIGAQEGKKVPNGTRIQTGQDGRVQVGMSPDLGKSVLIEEKSIVTVTPQDETKAMIKKGSVFAVLDRLKPGATFQLETPRGIAGVRGTIFRVISMPSGDKDAVLVSEGNVSAFSPDLAELGGIAAGNKGYIARNQPLFTEPLSAQDTREMQRLKDFTETNRNDFRKLVGGFESKAAPHAPKKTGPAGAKSSKRPGYDAESGPTGPGGGFMKSDSREFIDNRYMGRYETEQRKTLDQKPPPPRESSDHP